MDRERVKVLCAVTSSLSLILLRGQLTYLTQEGFSPIALCNPGEEVQELQERESIPVFTIPMERNIAPLRDFVSLLRITKLLRQLRPTICNAGTPKAGLLVGIGAWFMRIPCRAYTLRGLRLETATGLKRRVLLLTERIACACAHQVICVSPSLREQAVHLGLVRREKTVVLGSGSSNGIDPSAFEPTPSRLEDVNRIRLELGLDGEQQVIGYVGRLTCDKGIRELLCAFKQIRESFPRAVLLLIGNYDRDSPPPPEVRTMIEALSGIIRVEFTSEIASYYLLMDVFVLPTYREGFPNTVLEAQAAGRPVITTQATGAIDSVSHGVTGLAVPVGDSASLADALLMLLSDPVRSREMGMAGRDLVHREFRREVIWGSLASLYQEMLIRRGPASSLFADSTKGSS